jgi:aspartyl-tRNA(Asn)/glutamyl-tRNA(Gln) amidotransferase subunit A
MSTEPCDLTIKEAIKEIASGELTVLHLCESCLKRIDALDRKIQAWALVDRDGAIATARTLDRELEQGKNRGPLHGIPFGIKDMFYTSGLRTEAGSSTWSGFIPDYDATSVANLKKSGAIILGKTQTTQFAYSDPAPTRNPWNINHTPGGSSSGSGAGVASGMCLAALGTQTLGSVLRPAAFNGIVGFKPHHGRISAYGVVPFSWTLDHVGILARSVEDTALVFQAIAGYDPLDSHSIDEAVPDCLSGLESAEAPKLGLLRDYFFDSADEEMRRHTEDVAQRLSHSGAQIQEVALPPGGISPAIVC